MYQSSTATPSVRPSQETRLTRVTGRPRNIDSDRSKAVKHAKRRLHDQADHDHGVDRGVVLADVDDRL
jgi:hypothetical protein